ncbi:Attacin C and/or Gloverin domain containing protein [Asbolus verrucosus]|uniref:Attacin C and/or Gloverin domain containing protein n=1 Tax=Asbolus verrucosus TaxID=1661398 RepID=A0A482VAW6_ASBVE|nr:Attacin C and/or Gloverin domain containing protein [Asbolus verrucosus]
MQKLFVAASLCLAMAVALPYDLAQDEQGQHYYLVPVSRVRRDTDWNVQVPGGKFDVKHSGTIFENDNHKLEGEVYGSKSFVDRRDPLEVGGSLTYNHDSGSSLSVQAEHKRHQGTNLGIEGKYNLYRNGPFHVDVTGDYSRHYGGPSGTQHPSWNTQLTGTVDF